MGGLQSWGSNPHHHRDLDVAHREKRYMWRKYVRPYVIQIDVTFCKLRYVRMLYDHVLYYVLTYYSMTDYSSLYYGTHVLNISL